MTDDKMSSEPIFLFRPVSNVRRPIFLRKPTSIDNMPKQSVAIVHIEVFIEKVNTPVMVRTIPTAMRILLVFSDRKALRSLEFSRSLVI